MLNPQLRERRLMLALGPPAAVFVAVWAFRFLSIGAIENDHFVALARAHQVLDGAWPVRDFVDPGQPLTYLASAAAARVFGPTLLTEVVLAITLLALAAAVTFRLAWRASDSVLIAAAAVAVEVAAGPRLYNAGKVLFPLAAIALGWRYVDAPSVPRLAVLAGWTALACLWRHDYAVYIGVPTIGLLLFSDDRDRASRFALVYVALCVTFLLPWLIYVQWAGGLLAYIASAIRFSATEAQRTVVGWPSDPRSLITLLVLIGVPPIAVGLAWRAQKPLTFHHVAYAAAIALAASLVLLRDVISTRMPDVIGITAVLAAWIAGRIIPKSLLRIAAGVALVLVGALVVMRLASQGYGIPTPAAVARRFATVTTLLRSGAPEVIPNRERLALIRYLASCTPADSRVLVSGFGPEIPVLAGRPFAAGLPTWIPGYYTAPSDVDRAASQLSREAVSVAVMLEGSAAFAHSWPRLANDLRARHFVERTWQLESGAVVVWIPEDLAVRASSAPPACEQR